LTYRILLLICISINSVDAQTIEESKFEIIIPSQSLSRSLNELSEATNVSILFSFDLVEGKQGPVLHGRFTLDQALTQLLLGANLKGQLTDTNFVVIKPITKQKSKLNGNIKMKTSQTSLAKVFAIIFGAAGASHSALSQEIKQEQNEKDLEIIQIIGIKGSFKKSLNDKRFASQIIDTISAEDIGQLPDENIAEALQRITGVQMARSADGEGSTLQIRGISNNNVQINGQLVSGSSANRTVNFQDLNSELFSSVQVSKAPIAAEIEGSLGGTVNLITRKPLDGNKDVFASVNVSARYAEIADEYDPTINGFFKYNFRDTQLGDFGVLFNISTKSITSVAQAYGGGDYDDAPAVWLRQTGETSPPTGGNNANGANLFNPARGAGPWAFDPNVDVNGDGLSNGDDVFYLPGGFGFFNNTRDSERDSFNATFQWQPSDSLNIYLDTTITNIEETSSGSRYQINFNAVRSAPLLSGDNNYDLLNTTEGLGDVYVMSRGRIGNATTRLGASPSINTLERDSKAFNLGLTWNVSDNLTFNAELATSNGKASTLQQGALIMGIDYNGNGVMTGSDFAQFVDFDFAAGRVPDATIYESPFPSPAFGQDELNAGLPNIINPGDANYERLAYFQFNRVAQDTENGSDAFRIDGEWVVDGALTSLEFGLRIGSRDFKRTSFQNSNQRSGPSNLYTAGEDLRSSINVQAIRVNSLTLTNPDLIASSELLQNCLAQSGSADFLSDEASNLPRTWTSTTCSPSVLSEAFGLQDIRTINPDTGVGAHERTGLRFDVKEDTTALYLMANFNVDVGDMALYGNLGARYVETETSSSGFIRNREREFESITLKGEYNDFLPSLNANLALNEEMILRLGVSRSLARPGLAAIAPGFNLTYSEDLDGFAGTGSGGNPDLDPINSENFDLSYEWYYADASTLSVAYFYKDISTIISLADEQTPLQIGDELFLVRIQTNFSGTKISGYELSLQHAFADLPGLLGHTGIGMNYTNTDEESGLIDDEGDAVGRHNLSENSYNISAYYDDGGFSLRLAYNWRDEFVRRENVTLGYARPDFLPEIEAARGQLDFSANYIVNKNMKVSFTAVNLNNSETERFMKYDALTNYIANAGRRYSLGIVYRM
ncbi:MAG: iron complex outermembrane receptor protein, partial [Paraglaciecola sp.]